MASERKFEVYVPSILGCEKVAMEAAAAVAKQLGFPADRIEDLKTAVAEACINAIEHSHKMDASMKVGITLTVAGESLQVDVQDQGTRMGPVPTPNLENRIEGKADSRGWGIFLIKSLMDEVTFESTPEGNVVKMMIHLTK